MSFTLQMHRKCSVSPHHEMRIDALDDCPEAEGVTLSFHTTSGANKLTSKRVLVIDIFPLSVIRRSFGLKTAVTAPLSYLRGSQRGYSVRLE
jgi:hypothetical protein